MELEDRIVCFAARCVKVCSALPTTAVGSGSLADQLFRSSTGIAANYAEACEAESAKDFVHKLKISMKELSETRVWLKLIGEVGYVESPPPPPPPPSGREEPIPKKNHHPPLGAWPTYTALAKAIANKNGKPGTAGGIQQKLTNFWVPSRRRYAKANAATRQKLESVGIIFDEEGFVTSCANVPYPLS